MKRAIMGWAMMVVTLVSRAEAVPGRQISVEVQEYIRKYVKGMVEMIERIQSLPADGRGDHGTFGAYGMIIPKSLLMVSVVNRSESVPKARFTVSLGSKEVMMTGELSKGQWWREKTPRWLHSFPVTIFIKEEVSGVGVAYQLTKNPFEFAFGVEFEFRDEPFATPSSRPYFLVKKGPVNTAGLEVAMVDFLEKDEQIISDLTKQIEPMKEGATKSNLGALRSAVSIYYGKNEGDFPQRIDDDTFVGHQDRHYIQEIPKETITGSNRVQYLGPDQTQADGDGGGGWLYRPASGEVWVNLKKMDSKNQPYSGY